MLCTDESKLVHRKNESIKDGLSELEASVESVYAFIRENSTSELGMCAIDDLRAFLTEFMRQR